MKNRRNPEAPTEPLARRPRPFRSWDTERLSAYDCDICGDPMRDTWDDAEGWAHSYCPSCRAAEDGEEEEE